MTFVTWFLASLPVVSFADGPEYCSPAFLVSDRSGTNIYIADATACRILHLDSRHRRVVREIALPDSPTGMAMTKAGDRLYVTSRSTRGDVFVVDLDQGNVASVLKAGHTGMAPVLSADESILYVCNRFENSISVIDVRDGRAVSDLRLVREPVAAALTADGRILAAVNHQSDDPSDAPHVAAAVTLIDVLEGGAISHVRLPNGSVAGRGVCISPGDRYAFVSHILARNHLPATQLENGWLITNAVSVIDLEKKELLGAVILDDVGRGAANPWGVACTADGQRLCVALAGVHEVAVIDLPEMVKRLREFRRKAAESGRRNGVNYYVEDTYTAFGFLKGLKKRMTLSGQGPRHIAVAGGKLYAGMYFSGTLECVDLTDLEQEPESIPLRSGPPPEPARRGESLFNDASICFQGWQSCASCHPEGRADGLNWDLTNDGIGNFKNAKSLLFADQTPPSTMTGVFESLEECVSLEIMTILFAGRQDENAAAIVSYIRSLKPVVSPHLKRGRLSVSVLRGREVFREAGCSDCHRGEYFTSGSTKDVGTFSAGDHRGSFDIPSLREAWRTAPYLHDGRARTVEEVITKFNPAGKHGETADLTDQQIADLVNYVLSL